MHTYTLRYPNAQSQMEELVCVSTNHCTLYEMLCLLEIPVDDRHYSLTMGTNRANQQQDREIFRSATLTEYNRKLDPSFIYTLTPLEGIGSGIDPSVTFRAITVPPEITQLANLYALNLSSLYTQESAISSENQGIMRHAVESIASLLPDNTTHVLYYETNATEYNQNITQYINRNVNRHYNTSRRNYAIILFVNSDKNPEEFVKELRARTQFPLVIIQGQFSLETMKNAMIAKSEAVSLARIAKKKEIIENEKSTIERFGRENNETIGRIRTTTAETISSNQNSINQIKNPNECITSERAKRLIGDIASNPRILSLAFPDTTKLRIMTARLQGEQPRNLLGSYYITLNASRGHVGQRISFRNRTLTVGGRHHPHINGSSCLGNSADMMQSALSQGEIGIALSYAVAYAGTADIADAWGEQFRRWPGISSRMEIFCDGVRDDEEEEPEEDDEDYRDEDEEEE